MSSGAAQRNENPRSGLSSSRLEIPRSAITPSSGGSFKFRRHFADLRKFCVHQNHLFFVRLQSFPRDFKRLRVAIDRHQPPRRQPPGNFDRVPARAGRRVHIRPLGPDAKPLDHFRGQNRRMQNAQNLNAQVVQCLFVFRRDRITVHLIQEPGVIPDFQIGEVPLKRPLRLSSPPIPAIQVELKCAPAHPPRPPDRNSWFVPETSAWPGCAKKASRASFRSLPTPSWDRSARDRPPMLVT